ncbi:MAG: hypothetical protein FWH57_06615 [Oscillospiraceae bacterium]|nr:hypothetical protein [Oscillospiraceae bacterium]
MEKTRPLHLKVVSFIGVKLVNIGQRNLVPTLFNRMYKYYHARANVMSVNPEILE